MTNIDSNTAEQKSSMMQMGRKYLAAFPGKYIQREKAVYELPQLNKLFGKKGLVIASPTSMNKILPEYGIDNNHDFIKVEEFQKECSEKEINRINDLIRNHKADVLVGMGGGKVIDAAKIAADRANIPVIIVPTIASTDAPCSGLGVVYTEQGVFEKVCYTKLNPQIVLVDTTIIASAPSRFLVAGIGDALATWFEARSCERAQSGNECGGYSTMTGLSLSKLCYDTIIEYGPSAKIACENKLVTAALNKVIEANILLSGIGFESSGLAAAHSIHNGLSIFTETHSYYHGEKVAFGVLTGLHLTDANPEEIELVYSYCEKIGLPTTLSDIGIKEINYKQMMEAAEKACAPAESIHHEAVQITPEKVYSAMIMADAMGRMRKV